MFNCRRSRRVWVVSTVFFFGLIAGCGGGKSSTVISGGNPIQALSPEDVSLFAPDGLFLEGAAPEGLNARALQLRFKLVGAEFAGDQTGASFKVNGNSIPLSSLTTSPTDMTASVSLEEGKNTVSFKAYDTVGRPVYKNETIWAGSNTLQVRVVDSNGAPVSQPVDVSLKLADDATIGAAAVAVNGSASFNNLPNRTVVIEAKTADNQAGVSGGVGSDGTITVRLAKFNASSSVNNNDFSQGLDGWEIGGAPATIIPHIEGVPTTRSVPDSVRSDARNGIPGPRVDTVPVPGVSRSRQGSFDNNDLQLETSGEGAQSISRTFNTPAGTTSVKVRYRFITTEVPGGYFGSEFNDYFGVTLRSQKKGSSKSESNTMNGLGLDAFDFDSGATAWRTATLETDPAGDTIQLDVTVANVEDGALDSSVVIDFIAGDEVRVKPTIAWNPQQGGLKVGYTIEGQGALENPATIDVFFASGTTFDSRIGTAVHTITVPAGTLPGAGPTVNVAGTLLENDPAGAAFLIASSSETQVASVPDVKLSYGANADVSAISVGLNNLVKDSLRIAGRATATINSTARNPEDQARAMFNNLTGAPGPLAANVATQLEIYAPPGEAVINTFAGLAGQRTLAEVVADAVAIKAAMVAEINTQGPTKVSKHCSDPAIISVVDLSKASVDSSALFKAAAKARASDVLDENGVFHIELNAQ
jgi:hypothetical protein